MRTTYSKDDVILLLKDLTSSIEPEDTYKRELKIQSGVHYSEMLPKEYAPTKEYNDIYDKSLETLSNETAEACINLANKIFKKHSKLGINDKLIIVSLARAGLPIGILLKRYIREKFNIEVEHYGISIIRGKGIDKNAMRTILENNGKDSMKNVQFVDGWTGKGMIQNVLKESVDELRLQDEFKELDSELGVVADPANVTELCGTSQDILIPSACLNSTVSGLLSRTILNDKFIGEKDYHGSVYFEEFEGIDKSNEFIDIVYNKMINNKCIIFIPKYSNEDALSIVNRIGKKHGMTDINKIKPGIGEATRVLLRRVPWKIIINNRYKYDIDLTCTGLEHIKRLCVEKGVEIEYDELGNYKVFGLIKEMGDI